MQRGRAVRAGWGESGVAPSTGVRGRGRGCLRLVPARPSARLVAPRLNDSVVSRALAGDVVSQVAAQLPEGVTLLTRAPGAFQHAEVVVVADDEPPRT